MQKRVIKRGKNEELMKREMGKPGEDIRTGYLDPFHRPLSRDGKRRLNMDLPFPEKKMLRMEMVKRIRKKKYMQTNNL